MRSRHLILATAITTATTILYGCPDAPIRDTVTLQQESGGGYTLSGPHDLTGTLTKADQDADWVLEGSIFFPTTGYTLLQPEIAIAESYPEQVFIDFRIRTPASGATVAQIITEASFRHTISASEEATFSAEVITLTAQ